MNAIRVLFISLLMLTAVWANPTWAQAGHTPADSAPAANVADANVSSDWKRKDEKVPNVVGLWRDEAILDLFKAGLRIGDVHEETSTSVADHHVISESPAAGTEAKGGSKVDLVIARAPEVKVPDVVGLTLGTAKAALDKVDLKVGRIEEKQSTTVAAGLIISQHPRAGTTVREDRRVRLVVSKGTSQDTVPNVIGATQAAAATAIASAGLTVGTVTSQSSPTVAVGLVISESPAAGSTVTSGSAVNLVVSTGVAKVTVPNVVGLTQAAATTAITSAGLAVGSVTTRSSSTVAAGLVISESPSAGSSVAANSAVSFVVSTGVAKVAVPNVVGQTQSAATTAITAAGLTVGTVTTQSSQTVTAGLVISESPTAGTSVANGTAVNLVVSSGSPNVAVPNVVGLTQAAAATSITSAGLNVGTVTMQSSATVAMGLVISESPSAGSSVAAKSAVNLVVSSGVAKVAVPNVLGLTQAAATTAITGVGLTVGTITNQSSTTVAAGLVISESPTAGTSVATGSAVNLVVSAGTGALPGNPNSSAMNAITNLAGDPHVPTGSVDNDPALGQVARNRAELIILPTATVGQVNAAITSVSGHIISMLAGYDGIVLEFQDPGSLLGLQSILNSLKALPGIASADEISVDDFPLNFLPANDKTMDLKLADLAAAGATGAWSTSGLLSVRGSVPAASGNITFIQLDVFGLGGPGTGIAASLDSSYILSNVGAAVPSHGYGVLSRTLFDYGGSATLRGEGTAIAPFPISQPVLYRPIDLYSAGFSIDSAVIFNTLAIAIQSASGKVVFNASVGQCPNAPARCSAAYQIPKAINLTVS